MFFEEPTRRTELPEKRTLPKKRTRALAAAERRVADYCSIRKTMREVNRCLALDDELEAMTPMNGQ